jgi:hypothetical protein
MQLAVLLGAVSSHAAGYTVYEHQCYWFAGATWDALQSLFGGTVTNKRESSDLRPSTYKGLTITQNKANSVIVDEYRMRLSMVERRMEIAQQKQEELAEQVFVVPAWSATNH